MNSFKCVHAFQIELEFGSVGFWGEGKTGVPGEKPLTARERTNNKLNPHMVSTLGEGAGIEKSSGTSQFVFEELHLQHPGNPYHEQNTLLECVEL